MVFYHIPYSFNFLGSEYFSPAFDEFAFASILFVILGLLKLSTENIFR